MNMQDNTAGIDVSKANLDVDISPIGHPKQFTYNPDGLKQLTAFFKKNNVTFVVVEATGGLERRLVAHLAKSCMPFSVVNPRRVRDFAKAMDKLAKTDKIDARMIAEFGHKIKPRQSELPCKSRQKLTAAVVRHKQLLKMQVAETNRLDRTEDREMRKLIEKMIKHINQQIERVEKIMDEIVAEDANLKEKARRLSTVPGIGKLTAGRMVAMLPELGACNRGQIARLVGLAPINRDSGTMRGKRTTGGGRVVARTALYMPTLVARRHNPIIRDFYEKLVAKGKCKMSAIVAAMRKLVIILNVMIRDEKDWENIIEKT